MEIAVKSLANCCHRNDTPGNTQTHFGTQIWTDWKQQVQIVSLPSACFG